MTPPFTSLESQVWLQTRRLLLRRVTPRVDLIESPAPRAQVEEWMHDEVRRYKAIDQMFRDAGMKR